MCKLILLFLLEHLAIRRRFIIYIAGAQVCFSSAVMAYTTRLYSLIVCIAGATSRCSVGLSIKRRFL